MLADGDIGLLSIVLNEWPDRKLGSSREIEDHDTPGFYGQGKNTEDGPLVEYPFGSFAAGVLTSLEHQPALGLCWVVTSEPCT